MNTFKVYKDAAGGWRWSLHASNRKIIAESGEGYANAPAMVLIVRRHIVRDSTLLEEALARALRRAALDSAGRNNRRGISARKLLSSLLHP